MRFRRTVVRILRSGEDSSGKSPKRVSFPLLPHFSVASLFLGEPHSPGPYNAYHRKKTDENEEEANYGDDIPGTGIVPR